MRTESPYALADGGEAEEIVRVFNQYVTQNHPSCPTLEGRVWVDKASGVLFGSTPDARAILANKIVIGDLAKKIGFHVANHRELAKAYNDERTIVKSGDSNPEQYFFNDRFAFDSGLWIVNPHINGEINKDNAWNHLFAANVFDRMGEKRVFAVPDSVIDYLPSAKGQVPIRYIAHEKEGHVVSLDWSVGDTKGFDFHTFDLRTGVPQKGSEGRTMNKFYGLRTDSPTSALYVNCSLVADGSRNFVYSVENLRVVFSIGEADRA